MPIQGLCAQSSKQDKHNALDYKLIVYPDASSPLILTS